MTRWTGWCTRSTPPPRRSDAARTRRGRRRALARCLAANVRAMAARRLMRSRAVSRRGRRRSCRRAFNSRCARVCGKPVVDALVRDVTTRSGTGLVAAAGGTRRGRPVQKLVTIYINRAMEKTRTRRRAQRREARRRGSRSARGFVRAYVILPLADALEADRSTEANSIRRVVRIDARVWERGHCWPRRSSRVGFPRLGREDESPRGPVATSALDDPARRVRRDEPRAGSVSCCIKEPRELKGVRSVAGRRRRAVAMNARTSATVCVVLNLATSRSRRRRVEAVSKPRVCSRRCSTPREVTPPTPPPRSTFRSIPRRLLRRRRRRPGFAPRR